MECDICKKERGRRAYVMHTNTAEEVRHLREPFLQAPFVHPFNAPKYHAQQLRAVNFANAMGRRVLWIVATDKPLSNESDKSEKFSLCLWVVNGLFLGLIKKSWGLYNASLTFKKNLCRYVWPDYR